MNATAKHTPGPWTAVPDPIERGSLMVVGSDFPAMGVVTCINVYRHNEAGESDSDANARLIAAAPDMLAFLEAWTDQRLVNAAHLPDTMVSQMVELIRAARGA